MSAIFTSQGTEWCDELDTLTFYSGYLYWYNHEPIPLKMSILFGPVIHPLGIFPKEIY